MWDEMAEMWDFVAGSRMALGLASTEKHKNSCLQKRQKYHGQGTLSRRKFRAPPKKSMPRNARTKKEPVPQLSCFACLPFQSSCSFGS